MDVININENDVKDVDETVEPLENVEQVEAKIVEDKKESNISINGMIFAVVSLILGAVSCLSVFTPDYSFIVSMIISVAGCIFAGKYLFDGNKHKIFGKLAFTGFSLSTIGIILGIIRFILAIVAGVGVAFLKVLF